MGVDLKKNDFFFFDCSVGVEFFRFRNGFTIWIFLLKLKGDLFGVLFGVFFGVLFGVFFGVFLIALFFGDLPIWVFDFRPIFSESKKKLNQFDRKGNTRKKIRK